MALETAEIFFGNIPRKGILDVIEDVPDLEDRFPFIMLSTLDSTVDLSTVPAARRMVDQSQFSARFLDGGLLLRSADGGLRAIADTFLDHNDALCFFESEPTGRPPMILTSERTIQETRDSIGEETFRAWADWMHANHCTLALGDGDCGLNYASTDARMAEYLEGVFA